jgi:hypothetical protein
MNPSLILLTLALSTTSFLAHASTVGHPAMARRPNRDEQSFRPPASFREWPADGPKLAWKSEKLGKGHGRALSIVGGKIFTTSGRKGGQFLVALDLATRAERIGPPEISEERR